VAQVLALVPDLMLASRVEATLAGAGHDVRLASDPGAAPVGGADLIVADVGELDPAVLTALGPPVLGFHRHTDPASRRAAEEAGVALVVPRSRMARELPELVERVLGESRSER
jgi:hypothetical protein